MLIIDDSDLNADWIKTGTWDLPTDPAELEALFGPDWYATLSRLPAWQAAPPQVKAAAPATLVKFAPGLRPVLKHGSPGDKGYAQMHPTGAGGAYAQWGDHAERIRQAESRGPSEEALRGMISDATIPEFSDEEVASWVEVSDPEVVDRMITQNDDLALRAEDIEGGDYETEFERQTAMDELRYEAALRLVEENGDYYPNLMRRSKAEERDYQGDTLLDADATDQFREVFDYTHEGVNAAGVPVTIEAQVKFAQQRGADGMIRVQGDLMVNGVEGGKFVRDFSLDQEGRLVVSHEWLKIDAAEGRGTGFATEFNARAEDYYVSHGVDRIKVHAALENGGYTWAQAGFDFDPQRISVNRKRIQDRIDGFVKQYDAGVDNAKPRDIKAMKAVSRRMDLSPWDEDFPTPSEIANLGRVAGAETWPGKTLLVGSDWFGEKPLRPGGRRISATERRLIEEAAARVPEPEIPGQKEFDFNA